MRTPTKGLQLATSAALIALASDGAAPDWVKLFPYGDVLARDGRRWTLPKAKAASIIATSLHVAGSQDLPFDYDHQSDLATVQGVGGQAKASGWIKEFEARDDGIYARVEWTPAAAQAIAEKEYRYVSPTFAHTKAGEITCIRRAALTNTPALDLPALASELDDGDDMNLKALAAALGQADSATEEEILAAATKAGIALAAADKVRTALKLGADADGDAMVTAIAAAGGGSSSAETVITLQTELNQLKTSIASDKAEAKVDAAIKEGKVIPAARDEFIALASSDPARFDAIVGKLTPVIKPGAETNGGKLAEDGSYTLTDAETALCSDMGWDPTAYAAERKKELTTNA